jgi:hypothetical protein
MFRSNQCPAVKNHYFSTSFPDGNNFGYNPGDGFSTAFPTPPDDDDHHTEVTHDSLHVQNVGS